MKFNISLGFFALLLLGHSVVFIFWMIRKYNLRFRNFYIKEDDEDNTNKKFFLNIKDNLELRHLLDNIALNIKERLKIEGCAIYIFEANDNKYYLRVDNRAPEKQKMDVFSKNNFLTKLLLENKRMLLRREIEFKKQEKKFAFVNKAMEFFEAEICIPIIFNNNLLGFIFLTKKQDNSKFCDEDFKILKYINLEISLSLNTAISYNDLKKNYLQTIDALVMTIEAKDENTKGHSERVQYIAIEIAKHIKCSRKEIEILRSASILHDIGKIAIENKILNKPDFLTASEYNIIKEHPLIGEDIIAPIDFFEDIKHIVRQHHERWDGQGYPDGLNGKKILLLSRILHVADSFDSITHTKTYRKAKTIKEAITELKRCDGTQFDPEIIRALEEIFQDAVY